MGRGVTAGCSLSVYETWHTDGMQTDRQGPSQVVAEHTRTITIHYWPQGVNDDHVEAKQNNQKRKNKYPFAMQSELNMCECMMGSSARLFGCLDARQSCSQLAATGRMFMATKSRRHKLPDNNEESEREQVEGNLRS